MIVFHICVDVCGIVLYCIPDDRHVQVERWRNLITVVSFWKIEIVIARCRCPLFHLARWTI